MRIGVVIGIAEQDDITIQRLHSIDLDRRRRNRHYDDRPNAPPLRGQRNALRVVPGRTAGDPVRQLAVRQGSELVVRATKLEREDRLQVFALQPDAIIESGRQIFRELQWGPDRDIVDRCVLNPFQVVNFAHCPLNTEVPERLSHTRATLANGRVFVVDTPHNQANGQVADYELTPDQ